MDPQPPNFALKFLRWFCRVDCIEEIEGDLIELFELQCIESQRKAKRNFIWRVLLSFRPEFIRSFTALNNSNIRSMFKHNVLISYRNFKRYKSSFLINLIGLSSGLACVLLIWLWVSDELAIDKFHHNDSQLYEIMENVDQAGGMITRYSTAGPTAKALTEEFPEVEYAITATTMWNHKFTLTVGESDIRTSGIYADPDFFNVFSFDILQGSRNEVLSNKKSIVISKQLAINLFGTTKDVLGKTIKWEHNENYIVSGIMANVPRSSSIQFDFVLSFEHFRDNNDWITNWYNTAAQTYVILAEGTNVQDFNDKVGDLIKVKTENKATHRTPFATSFSDLYLNNEYENGQVAGGRIEYVKLFSIIAIFILIIACINFMNLSTAQASRRLKEVGVKKAMGAQRKTLVFQYLSESVLIVLLSLLVALVLVVLVLPKFNEITGKELLLIFDQHLIVSLLLIMCITGFVAGSYPAIYLSGFNPIIVLKGKLSNLKGEQWARRGLVVFQFSLSIILIVAVWIVYQQIHFVQTESLGYDKENILVVEKTGKFQEQDRAETFLNEVGALPEVLDVSAIGHDLTGRNGGTYGIDWPGKDPNDKTEFEKSSVDYGVIELMEIEVVQGRTFSKEFSSDTAKIMFNQAAIDFIGLEDPLGKVVKLWGQDLEIIGVTNNFHFDSFREEIKPLFFYLNPNRASNMMIKIQPGKEKKVIAGVMELHERLNPGFEFDYHFLDENYDILYASEQRVSELSQYFAGLAIVISCLGLFGLAAFTAERRIKEIGIRKILGSGEFNIIFLLIKDFTKMVVVSIVIALPISYFITKEWLSNFVYRIDLEWWVFIGAGALALIIAWLTVSIQTYKVSRVNPVDCLKNE